MKKVLIDTNIILDLFAKREPFYLEAAKLFSLADKMTISLFVSALSFANLNYILSKQKNSNEAKQLLRRLKLIVSIIDFNDKILSLSLNDNDFKDFEDALQYYSATTNSIDVIITRNLKDFQCSQLPVMTAQQFIKSIE